MKNAARKWIFGVGGLALLSLLILRSHNTGPGYRLSNGSKLYLDQVKFGTTNEFVQGTRLGKLFAPLIPANGVRFGRWNVQQPIKRVFSHPEEWAVRFYSGEELSPVTGLTAQFRLHPPLRTADSHRRFRWVIDGGDRVNYVQEFWEEGSYAYLDTTVFPRCAKRLTILLQEREGEDVEAWREAARFSVNNPGARIPKLWATPQSPETKILEGIEFTLAQPVFLFRPAPAREIWAREVRFPFRISSHGTAQTNWSAERLLVEDSSGNIVYTSGVKTLTNQWLVYSPGRSVDPRLPWRIRVDFGIDSDWPSNNLFRVDLNLRQPAPAVAVITNSNGTLIRARSFLLTNFNAVPVTAYVDSGGELVMKIPTHRTDLRLTYLGATDQAGRSVGDEGASWNQHEFSRSLSPSAFSTPGGGLKITVAIARNYHLEFYCRPRMSAQMEN